MKTLTEAQLESELLECFTKNDYNKVLNITHRVLGNGSLEIAVSRMYEFVEVNFGTLLNLSTVFGTQKFNVGQSSYGGCETCDYGSSYSQIFIIEPGHLTIVD